MAPTSLNRRIRGVYFAECLSDPAWRRRPHLIALMRITLGSCRWRRQTAPLSCIGNATFGINICAWEHKVVTMTTFWITPSPREPGSKRLRQIEDLKLFALVGSVFPLVTENIGTCSLSHTLGISSLVEPATCSSYCLPENKGTVKKTPKPLKLMSEFWSIQLSIYVGKLLII